MLILGNAKTTNNNKCNNDTEYVHRKILLITQTVIVFPFIYPYCIYSMVYACS